MSDVSISDHALLSDCHTAALVTRAGSVDWLCLPRVDSASVFGRLLDDDAGHFVLAPADPGYTVSWRYLPSTLVLETTWTSPEATLVVTDALALGPRERGHRIGQLSPQVLLRRAQCTRGETQVAVDFQPRPEFGLIHPRLGQVPGGVVADGGSAVLLLSSDAPLRVTAGRADGVVILAEGEEMLFALEQGGCLVPETAFLVCRSHPSQLGRHRERVAELVEPAPDLHGSDA